MKIQEHNAETNEITIREATQAEIENAASVELEIKDLRETHLQAKTALLNRLGITADEARLLL
jgi:hypothetical protein